MKDAMVKEIIERVDALAAKLGVAGDHLWSALIKQGYFEGVYSLTCVVITIILTTILSKKVVKFYQGITEDEGKALLIFAALLVYGLIAIFIIDTLHGVYALFNPEYFALKQLL